MIQHMKFKFVRAGKGIDMVDIEREPVCDSEHFYVLNKWLTLRGSFI